MSKKREKQTSARKQPRIVLSEEEYTSTLNDIVQREYFPALPSLRRQVAVLDRRAEGDFAGAVAIRRAARQLEEHEQALSEADKEAEENVGTDNLRKEPRPLHRETISGFHARVTSEDNAEFDATQRDEVQQNRNRLQQVFSLRIANGTGRGPGSETPLLASDKFNPSPHRITASEWKEPARDNGLFFNPQHSGRTNGDSRQKLIANGGDSSSGALSTESQLMPPPEPVNKSSNDTSSALVLKQDMVEYIPKYQMDKKIEPSQTRFPTMLSLPPQRLIPPSGHSSTTDYSTEASTDLDSPLLPVSVERRSRAKRIRREQETLVNMTPQIVPGRSAGNESPIVTWGTVSSTPMVLGGVDNVGDVSFRLPAKSDRDDAARRAEATLEKRRRKSTNASAKASTASMDRMTASLTPAARSLLNKSTMRMSSSARSRSAFGSALRTSYTPKRSSTASLKRDHAGKATPRVSSGSVRPVDSATSNSNLTDGLLKLPK
jgi:protein DGCR14